MSPTLEQPVAVAPTPDARRLRDALCSALADSGALALAALDGTRLLYASPAFLQLLDIPSLEDGRARLWRRHIHADDRERVGRILVEAQARGESCRVECRLLGPDGGSFKVCLEACPAGAVAPQVYALLVQVEPQSRNVPAQPRLPAPVQRAFRSRRDGVLERASDLLVDSWMRSQSLAVLAVGLHCPALAWSPQVQAQVEAVVQERMRRGLRQDDVIGRQGDAGLLVAIPNLRGPCAAAIVAGRLIEAAALPVDLDGQPFELQVHIGIALFPHDDKELSGLLAHARAALELARQAGPNSYSLAESSLNGVLRARPMPWDPRWNLGVADLDSQHVRLVADLDEISRHIGVHSDPRQLRRLVDRLQRNLQADFYAEEAVMAAPPDEASVAHRRQHEQVLRNFRLVERADMRQGTALLAQYLYDWLPQHIRACDAPLLERLHDF